MRTEEQNCFTQPPIKHKVFNNWDVVAQGWYIICASKELSINQVLTRNVNGQKICVFRDSQGETHAMDGFCPHMGVDLGIGKVVNDRVRCFFHHWEYGTDGLCKHIPIQNEIPKKARLQTYASTEAYGFVWVHPDKETHSHVLEVPGFEGEEVTWQHAKPYERSCHYHITMINGIDPQHLRTVHNIHMNMDIAISEDESSLIEIDLTGPTPDTRPIEKLVKWVLGEKYGYSMKYADGCVAALTLMKQVSFFGKRNLLPEMHMIFAYQMIEPGRTFVQPIYVTRKRSGLLGWFVSQVCILFTRMGFYSLQGEDGLVYENIRFNTQNLLAMDAPVARYIRYINRLKPSCWNRVNESEKQTNEVLSTDS